MGLSSEKNRTLRVDIVGADQRTLHAFQMAFSHTAEGRFSIVNATVAEALIVDLDGPNSLFLWQDYMEQYPDRPTIVIASSQPELDSHIRFLQKPLDLIQLLQTLDDIQQQIASSESFNEPSLQLTATAHLPKATTQAMAAPADHEPWGKDESSSPTDTEPLASEHEPTIFPDESTIMPEAPSLKEAVSENTVMDFANGSSETLTSRLMGDMPDRTEQEYENDHALFLRINNYFLGTLQATVKSVQKNSHTVTLQIDDYEIVLFADGRTAALKERNGQLYEICTNPVERRSIKVSMNEENPVAGNSLQLCSTQALLWRIALWTYQGRLPVGTELSKRVYLSQWPNFTRLLQLPNALRIAALWTEQPMPLLYTADALGIPQRNVFAFYSAAYTCGLSGQARRDADNLFKPGAVFETDVSL